ncbi:MAG TPA: hypothetical protein VIX86_26215 [Streptosporangiaceae bacterium]
MTDTVTRPDPPAAEPPHPATAPTLHAAIKSNAKALAHAAERAEQIRQAPQDHVPKLVVSRHVRGDSWLDKIADAVNRICGSMWVFLIITIGIVVWLFAGNIVGFDKTPWPLLLVILNLPQLSIMISLQVSANRAQAASDKRAIADHETLIALHAMGTQQLKILHGQDRVLAILNNFASKDMPGVQQEVLANTRAILAHVGDGTAAE